MAIIYRKGDITNPECGIDRNFLLIHVCNNVGGFGKGVALAIANRWPKVRDEYKSWHKTGGPHAPFELGEIQKVQVSTNLWVVNMIAQAGYGRNNLALHQSSSEPNSTPPIRYDALEACLKQVSEQASTMNATVIGPRFGCGLAGGDWSKVEPIVNRALSDVSVYVYDL